jgi:hypothetical protein
MKCTIHVPIRFAIAGLLIAFSTALIAQNSIQLFGPVDKRLSQTGTGFGADAVIFNSTTLNLTCSASPITAVISSSADGTGKVMVDNNINVTVTAGSTSTGPTNVCAGGFDQSPTGPFESCFSTSYEQGQGGPAVGQDPDQFVATAGVPPIDISQSLLSGPLQVKIDLQDEGSGPGFYLASSTLYLDTNCTQGGVTGPALVTGNPIPASNPTPAQISQDFSFSSIPNQQIGFTYDLSEAQAASTLTIADGTIPQTGDMPLDPAVFQSTYTPQTSFATSVCLVHSGELLPNGQPACKVYTLECKVGTGATASGALCPSSSQNNELFQDAFNGPAFTLSDIATPNGPTFHEGIGFLMANEGWTGGPCSFDPAADLQSLPCPQNLLTSFTSGIEDSDSIQANARKATTSTGKTASLARTAALAVPAAISGSSSSYTSSGRTTHPNSTFITVAQVPEDLTTVTVAKQNAGSWINTSTASVTLSSQPPNLAGTGLPGAADFVASPIQSITYGISPASSVPVPGAAGLDDPVVTSGVACPTQANPATQPAGPFSTGTITLQGLADGYYALHYYAQDCAGTEELKFTQDSGGNWSTGFYTYPINVDTTAPVVASGPTLSPALSAQGTYSVGQVVTATYSCTDSLSGVTTCGSHTFSPGTSNTGALTTTVDTSSPGSKTYTVQAIDAAGNQTTASISYQVVSAYDSQIHFTISPTTVTYPQGATLTVQITPSTTGAAIRPAVIRPGNAGNTPSGTVKILDGSAKIATLYLGRDGEASYYLRGLSAGGHQLSAVYSGDAHNPGGSSAPIIFTVKPGPVHLDLFCWNSTIPYGTDYFCGVYANSDGAPPSGNITYTYDNGAPKSVRLDFGIGLFTISKPAVGKHTVVVSYAAQGNFSAAQPQTEIFTVTPSKQASH